MAAFSTACMIVWLALTAYALHLVAHQRRLWRRFDREASTCLPSPLGREARVDGGMEHAVKSRRFLPNRPSS